MGKDSIREGTLRSDRDLGSVLSPRTASMFGH